MSAGLVRAGLWTYAFSSLTLVANLISGVVTARGLGPQGRGVSASLATVAQLSGFFFAMGAAQSISYFLGRRREDGPRLLGTWLAMLAPLTILAIALTELLLPAIFAHDRQQALASGRWFLLTIALVIGLELNSGLLLGAHDFVVFNVLRFLQAAMVAAGVTIVWRIDGLTVNRVLVVATLASTTVLALGMLRSLRQVGIARPKRALGRTTLWYGIRGHGVMVAATINGRLDVAMLPAFVAASSVGIYSVAATVSLIIYQLSSTFAALLIPAAARDLETARQKVMGALFATLAVAGTLAIVLGLLARPLLGAVYGHDFRAAATTLRLLLPGAVLFAGSSIMSAGIYALGKPFTATSTQLFGMVVTVVGLLVFLRVGGITAAAVVSTVSYSTVFVATAVAYKRVAQLPWSAFLPTRSRLLALVR